MELVFSPLKNIPNTELHNNPTRHIIIIAITATQPPAIKAEISAFVPAIMALTVDIVVLTTTLTPCAVLLAYGSFQFVVRLF